MFPVDVVRPFIVFYLWEQIFYSLEGVKPMDLIKEKLLEYIERLDEYQLRVLLGFIERLSRL